MPRHAVFVHQDHQVEFHANSQATMFSVVVDGLAVVQLHRSKRQPHGTVWHCQTCQHAMRSKEYVIKHVVGMHYPAVYRIASRSGNLPFIPYTPEHYKEPRVLDEREPPLGVLQAWIDGAKPKQQQ